MRLILSLLVITSAAMAGPVNIDGNFTPGEWGVPVKHLSPYVGGGNTGPQQSVDLYWWTDAQRVYGAIVGDPSLPMAFAPANVYVYSSGTSLLPDATPGVYGDGNDVIIESGNRWHFSLNGPPWAGPDQLLAMTGTATHQSGADAFV